MYSKDIFFLSRSCSSIYPGAPQESADHEGIHSDYELSGAGKAATDLSVVQERTVLHHYRRELHKGQ